MSCIWPPPPSMPIPPPCILPCTCAPPPDTSPMSPMGPSASEKTNPHGSIICGKKTIICGPGKDARATREAKDNNRCHRHPHALPYVNEIFLCKE